MHRRFDDFFFFNSVRCLFFSKAFVNKSNLWKNFLVSQRGTGDGGEATARGIIVDGGTNLLDKIIYYNILLTRLTYFFIFVKYNISSKQKFLK